MAPTPRDDGRRPPRSTTCRRGAAVGPPRRAPPAARSAVGAGVALLVLSATAPARAGGPLGPNGSPIETSQYAVDLTVGVVQGNARVRGLGGAYVAVAEGVAGNTVNPVAPAIRGGWSQADFNYDLGLFFAFPGGVADKDWFNSGSASTDVGATRARPLSFLFLTLTNNIRKGHWGYGATFQFQSYGLEGETTPTSPSEELVGRFTVGHLLVSRNVGDFVVGGGLRLVGLSIVRGLDNIATTVDGTFQAGMLYKPRRLPLRIGAAIRTAAVASADISGDGLVVTGEGDRVLPGNPDDPTDVDAPGTVYLPRRVALPWDLSVGLSVQLGKRPYNFRWVNPEVQLAPIRRQLRYRELERRRREQAAVEAALREGRDPEAARAALHAEHEAERLLDQEAFGREVARVKRATLALWEARPRWYFLVTSQLSVFGPVSDAVGVESFVQQVVNRSGESATVAGHLGVETEAIPGWVTARAGTYVEPTRFSAPEASPRVHGTFGGDVRVIEWRVFNIWPEGTAWRLSSFIDAADRYVLWGIGFGNWH